MSARVARNCILCSGVKRVAEKSKTKIFRNVCMSTTGRVEIPKCQFADCYTLWACFVMKLSRLSQVINLFAISLTLLSVLVAKVPLRVKSRSLSWRQSHRQVGHFRRSARCCRLAVWSSVEYTGILLLHWTIHWRQIRHSRSEDRLKLQGIHVSTDDKCSSQPQFEASQPLSLFILHLQCRLCVCFTFPTYGFRATQRAAMN